MYLSKRDKLTDNNVVNQVKSLNKMVILECSRIIEINLLQHLNYVKDLNVNLLYPLLLTTLNSPSVLYTIFPFIFLISTII